MAPRFLSVRTADGNQTDTLATPRECHVVEFALEGTQQSEVAFAVMKSTLNQTATR
jgi:hypothetical protein